MDLAQLSREAGTRTATPFAMFDPHMDCIRVLIRDCSFFERRAGDWITLVYDNYPESGQSPLIGVVIKGMHYLIRQLELPSGSVVRITKILDELVKRFPDETITDLAKAELSTFANILNETEVVVQLPSEGELQPA